MAPVYPKSYSKSEIEALAKAVHDEIYSIENTLKRRGYIYARSGSIDSLVFPKDMPRQDIDRLYKYMSSRTFRNILKDIVARKQDILQTDYTSGCSDVKVSEYFNFLCSTRLVQYDNNSACYSLATKVDDFGPTLEWYVSELFKRELESTADWGVRIKDVKPGGDFDVLARDEAALVWVETKSTRPQDIDETEIRRFLQRDQNLDPNMSIFLVDTRDNLSRLVQAFENIITPVVSPERYASDPNYRQKIKQFPDFGGIYFFQRRIFIINSEPSILAKLRHCLRYYFAWVPYLTYWSRERRLDFLTQH